MGQLGVLLIAFDEIRPDNKTTLLVRPITTGANNTMNQSEFLVITCNLLKAREKSRAQGAIGFDFASHWLKHWREILKPITKRSNRNHLITYLPYVLRFRTRGRS